MTGSNPGRDVVRKKEKSMATIKVQGMKCQHCAETARKALEEIEGIRKVAVNLDTGKIDYEGNAPIEVIRAAIEGKGYRVVE